MQVLTDHGNPKHFQPHRTRISLKSPIFEWPLFKRPVIRLIPVVLLGIKCFLKSITFKEPGPFITMGSAHGFVFAFLQYLVRPFRKPRTHIMFAFLLERKRKGAWGILDSFKIHIFKKAVEMAAINGLADIETYSREYNIPKAKLVFVPFHITLESYTFEVEDAGYIFAGGNNGRDYHTLISAVKDINYPVFIATQLPEIAELAQAYPHITVKPVSHQEFRRLMARCTIFAEAHPVDFFRTAGHQTFLNAMWMGKPIVMADKKSSIGYFEDKKEGLVVDAGDIDGLRSALNRLLNDRELASRLAEAGKRKFRDPQYRTLNTMQKIYNLAIKIESEKMGVDPKSNYISLY